MKEVRIVSFDNRGRLVVPKIIRKSLGLTEDTQLMMVADSESKEIRITPVAFEAKQKPIKLKIKIKDAPGSLAKIASTFGELGMSLMYGESAVLEKDKTAIWTVISPTPEISLEEFKEKLMDEGGAIDVEIMPL
jgi:bifunctional DNA-binding transcriptional regulator/antitoxin component of YhaV-PrlF toxin-antitoxin module